MKEQRPVGATSGDTVKDRVRGAFPETAEGDDQSARQVALEYLTELRSRMKDLSEGIRRAASLLLLVAAVFQLLDQAAVVGLQAGPFQIEDLSIIQQALPVVFAYLIYDATVLGMRYLYSINVAIEISVQFQPTIRSNRLDVLLNPQGSPLFGPMLWHHSASALYRLIGRFMLLLRLGSVLAPLGIEGYAYYRLFSAFGADDLVIWISLLISLFFIVFAALVVLTALRDQLIRPSNMFGPAVR
jgi:hypothetical protein